VLVRDHEMSEDMRTIITLSTGDTLDEIFGNAIGTTTDAFVDNFCEGGQ